MTGTPTNADECPDFWPDGRHLDPPTDSCTCTPASDTQDGAL